MESAVWFLMTTVERQADAQSLSREAVREGLAACVQIDGPVESIFKWKGSIESGPEYRLLLKTSSGKRKPLMAWMHRNHPYEVPEILAWPANEAGKAYAEWVEVSTS